MPQEAKSQQTMIDIDQEPEGTDPEIKTVNEEQENSDATYAKMKLPQDRILCHRTMNYKVAERIDWVHQARGLKIMALWLQDMYLRPKAARLLIREQGLNSLERLKVPSDKI